MQPTMRFYLRTALFVTGLIFLIPAALLTFFTGDWAITAPFYGFALVCIIIHFILGRGGKNEARKRSNIRSLLSLLTIPFFAFILFLVTFFLILIAIASGGGNL